LDRYLNNRPPILVGLLDTPIIATDSGFNKGDNSNAITKRFSSILMQSSGINQCNPYASSHISKNMFKLQ
jgi:hypothetical protein